MQTSDAGLNARIEALAGPVLEQADIDLLDVDVHGTRGSRVVRVVADADGGLDIDRIARVSRELSQLLDDQDLIDGRYTLEVTSPGADRPLRQQREFARNLGRDLRVVRTPEATQAGAPGEVEGTLIDVRDDVIHLETERGDHSIPLSEVDFAKVVLPW